MKKYIILEIIPSSLFPEKGEILQVSALKIENFKLMGKFDKRIVDEKLPFDKLKELINYDNSSFEYEKSSQDIMQKFSIWVEDFPLFIFYNSYTSKYIDYYKIPNKKSSVFDLLEMKYHDFIIDDIMKKYNLQPSNYIVDLLFEALLQQDNINKKQTKL